MNTHSALEWEKPGKLYVVLQRFKSDRKQIRRGAACAICRKNKRRCDGQRPCKSCISSKSVDKCMGTQTEIEGESKVERPLHFDGNLQFRDDELVQVSRAKKLKYGFLKGFWDMGFNEDSLNNIFRFLPPRLQSVYNSLSQVFDAAISQSSKVAVQDMSIDKFDVADGDRWSNSVYCGWLNIQFDTAGKRSNVGMNRVIQNLYGGHLEEVISRCGNQDLPLPSTEFRTLCAIFDEFLTFAQGGDALNKIRYLALIPNTISDGDMNKKPLLFRQTMQRVVRDGIPRRTTTTYVPVSAEQYDRALRTHPEVRNVFIDEPFLMPGAEIERANLWEEERIENMIATPQGRAKLEHLASLAFQMFHLPEPELDPLLAAVSAPAHRSDPEAPRPLQEASARSSSAGSSWVPDRLSGAQSPISPTASHSTAGASPVPGIPADGTGGGAGRGAGGALTSLVERQGGRWGA